MNRATRTTLHATAALAVLATSSRAQELLYRWFADDQGAHMGGSVGDCGDVDADGIHDVIVGISGEDVGTFTRAGSVRVFSGRDGTLLWDFDGAAKDDNFGFAVGSAGDVNQDGHADPMAGAFQVPGHGYIRVYDGATGAKLAEIGGTLNGEHFGSSVAGLGDVNGDGFDDFAAGGPNFDFNGVTDRGHVRVFSGKDFAQLYATLGAAKDHEIGLSLAVIGDLDGDGVNDFVAGGERHARICSGTDGKLLKQLNGDSGYNDLFGVCSAGIGDADGDAIPDFAIGAPFVNSSQGAVYVYSGSDWSLLFSMLGTGRTYFGRVGAAGDADGDGRGDLIVGEDAPFNEYGHAVLVSGRTGRLLYRFEAQDLDDEFGRGTGSAGDLDGDGFADPIVGASNAFHRISGEGSATVFRGNDLWLQAVPWIVNLGDPFEVDVRNGPAGGTYALYLVDLDGAPTFELLLVGTLDALGEAAIPAIAPSELIDHELLLRAYAVPFAVRGALVDSFDELLGPLIEHQR